MYSFHFYPNVLLANLATTLFSPFHIQVWDIPAIQVRAGADIPRDFPRAQPEGNPEEYLHLPDLGWQE